MKAPQCTLLASLILITLCALISAEKINEEDYYIDPAAVPDEIHETPTTMFPNIKPIPLTGTQVSTTHKMKKSKTSTTPNPNKLHPANKTVTAANASPYHNRTTKAPVEHSTKTPVEHSTKAPVEHSTKAAVEHSTKAVVVHSTKTKTTKAKVEHSTKTTNVADRYQNSRLQRMFANMIKKTRSPPAPKFYDWADHYTVYGSKDLKAKFGQPETFAELVRAQKATRKPDLYGFKKLRADYKNQNKVPDLTPSHKQQRLHLLGGQGGSKNSNHDMVSQWIKNNKNPYEAIKAKYNIGSYGQGLDMNQYQNMLGALG